jgi:hypothetical protein
MTIKFYVHLDKSKLVTATKEEKIGEAPTGRLMDNEWFLAAVFTFK